MKTFKTILFAPLVFMLMVLASCEMITPTVVPPMTDALDYSVPNWGGVTTTGLVRGSYELELNKLKLWKYSVDATLQATEGIRVGLVDLLAVLGLGGTAALPLALRSVPKTAVKKEDHLAEVEKAGKMAPEDFENLHS